MLIAVIADDLTGAADTGVQFVHAGYRAAVFFRATEMLTDDLDAVAFDTDSRAMPAGFAAKRVRGCRARRSWGTHRVQEAGLHLAGERRRRACRGLGGCASRSCHRRACLSGAGRTTVGGIQRVHGVPVDETEMANDPHTPVSEAHVPSLLADAFSSVGTLSVEDLADPERVRRTLEDYECVVADAERDADLEALVRAVPDPARVLWAGSAGLAHALGSVYPGPCAGDASVQRAPVRPVLVVVGSLSGVAREQVRRLVEEYGEVDVPVDGEEPAL